MITPVCCKYAQFFITLQYEDYWVEDANYFLKTTPFWVVRGSKMFPFDSSEQISQKITLCPSCGSKLPHIRIKATLPTKVMSVKDGGYYCNTCHNRLNECRCSRPEEMWEAIP